jgi:hypothetical protein
MDPSVSRIDLLLADAEDHRPALEDGLPADAAERGPKPKTTKDRDTVPDWRRTDADLNDLVAQRWAVVAPKDREGDRMLEAITPLIRLREREQGESATIHRVSPDMDARASLKWKKNVYWSEDIPEAERPLYVLLLGDLHQTSVELQQTLANGALCGRLHFANAAGETDLDGYAAYAEKAVRLARDGTPDAAPDLLFYAAPDGSSATVTGRVKLVAPSLAASQQRLEKGSLPAASVREISARTVDELLSAGSSSRPSVLLSVSHGLGAPRRGFRSEEEQRKQQGALVLDSTEILDAERLRGEPFLPGGMWFCVACFGAGTPQTSAYLTWLSALSQEGLYSGSLSSLLKNLPPLDQRPFVAALPQAALSNPSGPLAVISHIDLAWTHSFSGAERLSESRKMRILSALDVMVRGSRAGAALEALMRFYRETNDELVLNFELEADARRDGRPDPTDHVERGNLWMLRNDLRGYVLLGDPAARLPLRQNALGADAPAPAAASISAPAPAPARSAMLEREAAVLAMLRGDEAPRAIAARASTSLGTLWDWVDAYRAGGRARLDE